MDCVIAGSFRKFYEQIRDDVIPIFERAGIRVLYPPTSIITNPGDDYVIFKSDNRIERDPYKSKILSVRKDDVIKAAIEAKKPIEEIERLIALEQGFLEAGTNADFIYIFNPEGYIGRHTTFEVEYFLSNGKSVFALEELDMANQELDPLRSCFIMGRVRDSGGIYTPEQLVEYLIDQGQLKVPV